MSVAVALELEDDRASITTKDGFRRFVYAPERARPTRHSAEALQAMSGKSKAAYDEVRREWHSNLGPYETVALEGVFEGVDEVVSTNRQAPNLVRPGVVIDGPAGTGKTTAIQTWSGRYHRESLDKHGEYAAEGFERLPVCFISLTSGMTPKGLNQAICDFYALPLNGSAVSLGRRFERAIANHGTRVLVLDDIHFINATTVSGRNLSDHLKHIMSVANVTLLLTGIDVKNTGLLPTTGTPSRSTAQTGRRLTLVPVDTYRSADTRWKSLVKAFEANIVLAHPTPRLLAEDLSAYLYDRTQGSVSSLAMLLSRAAGRAIRTGDEKLSPQLLGAVRIDVESERRRTHVSLDGTQQASRRTTR